MPGFELSLLLPCDTRYAPTVRAIVEHASRNGGWSEAEIAAFATTVETLTRGRLAQRGATERVPVVVQCDQGPLEVRIGSQILTLDR